MFSGLVKEKGFGNIDGWQKKTGGPRQSPGKRRRAICVPEGNHLLCPLIPPSLRRQET